MEATTTARSLFPHSSVFQPSSYLSRPKLAASLSSNSTLQAQEVRPLSISKARPVSPLMKSSCYLVKCSPSVEVETEAEIPIEKSKQFFQDLFFRKICLFLQILLEILLLF